MFRFFSNRASTRWWTRDRLIALIDRTLNGDDIGEDWDDLCLFPKRGDAFEQYWAEGIADVESLYPPPKRTMLFADEGLAYLGSLRDELRALE